MQSQTDLGLYLALPLGDCGPHFGGQPHPVHPEAALPGFMALRSHLPH